MLEIAYAEPDQRCVESGVRERQARRVAVFQRDGFAKPLAPDLFPPARQHSLGNIDAHDLIGAHRRGGKGQIGGAGRHIQNPGRGFPAQQADRGPAPRGIQAETQQPIQQIVPGSHPVEHNFDGFPLARGLARRRHGVGQRGQNATEISGFDGAKHTPNPIRRVRAGVARALPRRRRPSNALRTLLRIRC